MNEKGLLVLILLFFLFFWLHQLCASPCLQELPHSFPVIFESTSFNFPKTERKTD